MAVRNQDVLNALIELGIDPAVVATISPKGAQGSTFRSAVLRAIGGGAAGGDEVFDRAKATAAWRPDPKKAPVDNLTEALRVRGIDIPANLQKISDRAKQLAGSRPGIRPTGTVFSDVDFYDAAAEVLGAGNPAVMSAFKAIGVDRPAPPPAPATGPLAPGHRGLVRPGVDPATGRPPAEKLGPPVPPGGPGGGGLGGGGGVDIQTIINNALAAREADVTMGDVDDIIQRVYGFSAMALDIPEVKAVLDRAAAEDWDEARIKGGITATGWWRRTSDSERVWTALEKQEPATATRKVEQQFQSLKTQVASKGFQVDDASLQHIAQLSQKFQWSPIQVQQALAAEFRHDPTGEKQTFATNLKRLSKDYVIPLSDQAVEQWGQQILAGTATEEDFQGYLTDQAKGMFPGLTGALDRGMSVRQFVDPYVQTAAKALEITPDEIDITDNKWLRAINQIDPKTGDRTVMSLSDWESTLKLDPQYGYNKTKRAKQEAGAIGTQILTMFGAR